MKILAIETSCDETAASIVEDGRYVLSSVIYSQVEEHKKYGGVVPEIASRRHTQEIGDIVSRCLKEASLSLSDVDAIAVTAAPGLIGALLVGVNYAKGLSLASGKPLIPVHHIRGHIAANYIQYPQLAPPFLSLIISGGHSHIVQVENYTKFKIIGRTRDDAVGEAFDKAARIMGFSYPGGVNLDKETQKRHSDPNIGGKYKLPQPKVEGSPYDFSFSGLKTSVINLVHNAKQKDLELDITSLCCDFQDTVSAIIEKKLKLVMEDLPCEKLVVAGGVSANSGIRATLENLCKEKGVELFIPPLSLCGDNAAMIGAQAYYEYLAGNLGNMSLNGRASMAIEEDFYEGK